MPRKKGSRLVNGRVVEPEALAQVCGAKEEEKPIENTKGIKATFKHGLGLEVILWKNDLCQSVIITAPEFRLPAGRLAERTALKVIEAINKL